MGFFLFTKKIFSIPIPENSWLFPTFFCGCPYEEKKIPLRRALSGHSVQKYFEFVCFNQKILLQTLVEIIFRYHKIFLEFWDPPTNKMKKNKMVTYGVLGIKIGWKGCVEFLKEILENIQKWRLWLLIF